MNTLPPKPLRQEIATAHRDIFLPVWSGLLRPQDDILASQGGQRGLNIYWGLERDAHVHAVMDKRKKAVIRRDWRLLPGGPRREDRKAAELAENVFGGKYGLAWDRVTLEQLECILLGYAVGEVIWDVRDGWIVPVDVKPKDPRRFVFDEYGQLRMLTLEDMLKGEELPSRKFLVSRHGDRTGDPYGLGLGHKLFWPVFFKRQGITFWAVFLEKFGSPTVKGAYDSGMLEEEQQKLLDNLAGIAQQSAIIHPKGVEVDLLEAARSGASDAYDRFIRYWDEQISEAVLGETLSTNIGKVGSKAAADTHNDVRDDLTDADCDLHAAQMNAQLVTWITDLNFPGAAPPIYERFQAEDEGERQVARKSRAEALAAETTAARAAKAAGFVPADPKAPLEEQMQGQWLPPPEIVTEPPPPAFAASDGRDAVDDLVDQARIFGAGPMDGLVAMVRAVINDAPDLQTAADRLLQVLPELDATELAQVLAQAMITANLQGALDLKGGA